MLATLEIRLVLEQTYSYQLANARLSISAWRNLRQFR